MNFEYSKRTERVTAENLCSHSFLERETQRKNCCSGNLETFDLFPGRKWRCFQWWKDIEKNSSMDWHLSVLKTCFSQKSHQFKKFPHHVMVYRKSSSIPICFYKFPTLWNSLLKWVISMVKKDGCPSKTSWCVYEFWPKFFLIGKFYLIKKNNEHVTSALEKISVINKR